MHWILQSGWEYEPGWVRLIEVLDRFEIPYSMHKVIPFVGDLLPEPEIVDREVICIGSYSMRHYAKKHGYVPGVYDLEPFDFTIQMQHWGANMLNADSRVVPFKDVVFEDEMFIRPVDDTKVFSGRVFSWEEFSEWKTKVIDLEEDDGSSLTKDTIVQVSIPKKIVQEARFWIVDGRVVTCSGYKRGDWVTYWSDVDQNLVWFAWAMVDMSISLDGWNPLPAFVLDVCELEDGTCRIVEINTINSAGFYAADMQKLVVALEYLPKE